MVVKKKCERDTRKWAHVHNQTDKNSKTKTNKKKKKEVVSFQKNFCFSFYPPYKIFFFIYFYNLPSSSTSFFFEEQPTNLQEQVVVIYSTSIDLVCLINQGY